MDYDAIVIGGGPAGLAAAADLAREKYRVLLLDRESFGGKVINTEWIDSYPSPGGRVAGPTLASRLVEEAERQGVQMELGEVVEIESYSGCRSVSCADGKAFTAPAVVVAGGLASRPLGVPGEQRFHGKGMIHCAFCDAGFYTGKAVAVCGGGDAGLIEAMLLAKYASRVHVIEAQGSLTARPDLQQTARANPKLDIRTGLKPVAVLGDEGVEALEVVDAGGRREKLDVHGVLPHVGYDAATAYLEGVVPLDGQGRVEVSAGFETDTPGIFAAGDIRSGSPRDVAAAISDGRNAAASAQRFLRSQ